MVTIFLTTIPLPCYLVIPHSQQKQIEIKATKPFQWSKIISFWRILQKFYLSSTFSSNTKLLSTPLTPILLTEI